MYQSHFNFQKPPFKKVTRASGDFFVPYHQDIFNLLKEKTQQAGITGLFCNDAPLLGEFSDALKSHSQTVLAINAFPKLSASSLLYKLSPGTKESKTRIQAIDAVIRQWQDSASSRKPAGKVVIVSHMEAMKDNCREILGMLLTRAQELEFRLSIVLMGSAEQEAVLMQHSGLQEYVHTHHTLRSMTCRETLSYVQAQCEDNGCETSPLAPARVRKMHTLTKGSISKFNALAHLALLAAWTERASAVGPRHLRLATSEILPAKKHGTRLATVGLFASVLFAACGWYMTSAITAKLPVQLPVPVSWKQQTPPKTAPVVPVIDHEVVNQPDAMHQLYQMWGYDASADDALCQNASKVNLMCRQGNAPLSELAKEGYPWVSEMHTGGHLNYAVVARVGDNTLDLLMNGRTWQVTRNWYSQHATGNYTQLHRLTPQGKDEISAASSGKDLEWLDQQLSQALAEPETHAQSWTAEMMKRTREFQQKMDLHVDGIPGEDTLMQLMRETNTTPSVLIQASQSGSDATTQEKKS
ncbi:peptidoglycan-binding protein [Enterobacter cancerogenus]|uniref:ExeA family protein n=1 Tax=Enterobacter cancerogenus TaxID=69218 RepID=UPI00129A0453|nr:peptidoglycan-binding domain-containing protein [Enterobacter cancerogenus]MRG30078.1 peptidoglycan-binding protein [Enterobacter cancerogenus]QZY38303.1 peptidoglycan-binding protein [Enterobacter cancerogenus]